MITPNELNQTSPQDAFETTLKPLWLSAQGGDETAYRLALEKIAQRLRRFYGHRLQALPSEVEDLVQETLLAIHMKRGTYEAELPVSSWIFAIARHKLVDLWRRRGRRDNFNDSLDDMTEDQHPMAPEELPSKRDLAVLLEQLPASQKQAILLTKIQGLSMIAASAQTGVSVAALKVQVHRGLKQLAVLVRSE